MHRQFVPQHGAPIAGRQAIEDSYAWIENLRCGIDLFDERNYQMPTALIDPRGNRSNPPLRVA